MSNVIVNSGKFVFKAALTAVVGVTAIVLVGAAIVAYPSIKKDYEDAGSRKQLASIANTGQGVFKFKEKDLVEASTAQGRLQMLTQASIEWAIHNGVPTQANANAIDSITERTETMSPEEAILLSMKIRDPMTKQIPLSIAVPPTTTTAPPTAAAAAAAAAEPEAQTTARMAEFAEATKRLPTPYEKLTMKQFAYMSVKAGDLNKIIAESSAQELCTMVNSIKNVRSISEYATLALGSIFLLDSDSGPRNADKEQGGSSVREHLTEIREGAPASAFNAMGEYLVSSEHLYTVPALDMPGAKREALVACAGPKLREIENTINRGED